MTELHWIFIGRLLLAGFLGALVGLDREYRAKEAGIRTHFLVALGSALMMLVSQWGFEDTYKMYPEIVKADPARLAAQVVSGIGFIGAGTIMMHKQFVRGLTTAAGLWAVAGIGLAVGCGLYVIAIAGTILTLIGLELLHYLTRNVRSRCLHVVFSTTNQERLIQITNELNQNDFHVLHCAVGKSDSAPGAVKVDLQIQEHAYHTDENRLLVMMKQYGDVQLEKYE